MKNILILAFSICFLASCQNNKTSSADQNQDTTQTVEGTQTSEITTTEEVQDDDAFDVLVVNRDDIDMYGGIALENEEGIFVYIHERKKLGKMIINGDSYKITKMTTNEGIYVFEGDGIEVSTSKCDLEPMESDCAYGTCAKVTVRFDGKARKYNDIKLQDCSNLGM